MRNDQTTTKAISFPSPDESLCAAQVEFSKVLAKELAREWARCIQTTSAKTERNPSSRTNANHLAE
jgi:hypothetical protein